MQTRERIHGLVDRLPDRELPAVERFLDELNAAGSSLRRTLANAPVDDEPLTDEDIAAIEEAYADLAAGRVLSDEEIWRRLGHEPRR